MKTEILLNDLEKLFKARARDDALTILKAFQRDILIEYRKWYEENYRGEAIMYSFFIDEFIEGLK